MKTKSTKRYKGGIVFFMKTLQSRKVEILNFLEKLSKNLVVSELYSCPVIKPSSSILSFFSLQVCLCAVAK